MIPETLQENWRLHRFFYYFPLPAAGVSKLSFRSFRPGTSMNCLFDGILQDTAQKKKPGAGSLLPGYRHPLRWGIMGHSPVAILPTFRAFPIGPKYNQDYTSVVTSAAHTAASISGSH